MNKNKVTKQKKIQTLEEQKIVQAFIEKLFGRQIPKNTLERTLMKVDNCSFQYQPSNALPYRKEERIHEWRLEEDRLRSRNIDALLRKKIEKKHQDLMKKKKTKSLEK
jgi:hypothetical protein